MTSEELTFWAATLGAQVEIDAEEAGDVYWEEDNAI